jgi:hypothetical protein
MPMRIVLQDERGQVVEAVEDATNLLASCLPDADSQSCCLKYIDVYGDTVFNRLQMNDLLEELEAVMSTAPAEVRSLLDRVAGLARRVAAEPHYYLKFVGD